MRNRVYVVAAEYSAPLSALSATGADTYRELSTDGRATDGQTTDGQTTDDRAAHQDQAALFREVFFSAPGDAGNWQSIGALRVPTLADLLTSAAHRALASLHDLCGRASYGDTRRSITDLLVASMPLLGATPGSGINAGLVPLMLRSALGLDFECRCRFVAGTADSGAGGFASAVRIAQSRPATVLVSAGQIIPSGYMGTYRIRSVFTEDEQRQGLDMMAVGDVLMDALRRTYAGPDTDSAQCRAWLADVRARKLAAARCYPAALGVKSADPEGGGKFVTPYFRADDVAKVGCGAAAVVVTSDPDTLQRIRATLALGARRHRNTPVVEVMGIGEGTTNPRLLTRRTPMSSGTSIRQALVTAASDGNLPLSVFPDSAFALLHDAFPSMELAVLLAVGLDWQRATLRMTTWWSNPCGGLLTFGDAVGASGLVQVCKAFHVFTGDRRYLPEPLQSLRHFRRAGSYAFTSSIGGPLSHLVVSILRGGVPHTARDQAEFFDETARLRDNRSPVTGEQRRRDYLQRSMRAYVDRLAEYRPSWRLVEGVTEIDARSCAQALSPAEIDGLSLARLPHLVTDAAVQGCRTQIVQLIHQLRADLLSAQDGSATFAARARYNAGLQTLLGEWHERDVLRSDDDILSLLSLGAPANVDADADRHERARAGVKRRLKALKQVIRVPVAVLISTGGRQLSFMTELDEAARSALERADFVDDRRAQSAHSDVGPDAGPDTSPEAGSDALSVVQDPMLLPWWNSRAERPRGPVDLTETVSAALASTAGGEDGDRTTGQVNEHSIDPRLVFDALMESRSLAQQRQAELGFLRAFFAPSGPLAAVDLAMRELGLSTEIGKREQAEEMVPAIFYKNDIIGSSVIPSVHEAYELLGRAVQRARGWFGMYASTCAQHGDSVSLVSLDRRLEPGGSDGPSEALHARTEAISNAARFARDVAEWCLGYGIRVRTVVSFGQGLPYRDVNDERSVASDSAIRGARLLDHVAQAAKSLGYADMPWIAFDLSELGDIDNAAELFARELSVASGPDWRQPSGPPSPVALERWDDVRFVVWYRPQ